MAMIRKSTRSKIGALVAMVAAGGALAVNCSTTPSTTVWTTSDLYAYDYYYPADLAYYDTYWVDTWYVDPYYYYYSLPPQAQTYGTPDAGAVVDAGMMIADAGMAGDAGAATDGGTSSPATTLATVLRNLARGDMICPGQVTVMAKSGPGCKFTGGMATIRTGATINFMGCMLSNGARIDGMVDYTAMPSASDSNCDANTTVTLNYTTKYTNLTYTAANGARWVIPSQTNTGSYTRKANVAPTMISYTTDGSLQQYDASNALVANHRYMGNRTFTLSRGTDMFSYKVDGGLTVNDVAGGNTVNITGTGITRTSTCCRPIGGTLTLTRGDSRATWTFGPSCGQATANGMSVTLPACQ